MYKVTRTNTVNPKITRVICSCDNYSDAQVIRDLLRIDDSKTCVLLGVSSNIKYEIERS